METALFDFVLDVTAAVLTHVAEHLGKHPLQCIVTYLTGDGLIAVVTDIDSCAVEVAGILGSVTIATTQAGYIFLRT